MQNWSTLDVDAPFSSAFSDKNLQWAGAIVSIGALMGIVTSLLLTLLGMARIFMVLGREKFIPPWIAKVHPTFHTPINATIITGVLSGLPALFLNIDFLAKMVSMGTLFVLCMVCLGAIWRQYFRPANEVTPLEVAKITPPETIIWRLVFIVAASLLEGLAAEMRWSLLLWIAALGTWLVATLSFYFLPTVYTSRKFNIPFKPITPSLGVLFTVHLMCSLGWPAYARFGIWQILGVVFYCGYSMHRTGTSTVEKPLLDEGPSDEGPSETMDVTDASDASTVDI